MNHLPTGMFLPGKSVIHRLDARVKFLALILLLIAVVCTDSLIGYGVMVFLTVAVILVSGIAFRTALSAVNRLYWFFIIILLMNICFFSPDGAWFSLWIFSPSPAGLMQGFNVVFRIFLVLVISNVLTSTTAPMEITGALESLISPLKWIGVPTGQVAMILSVAIQFIPTLFEETDMIRKAQTARGARFDSRKLREKAGAVMPLAVPIFLAAFKRADELSTAMEARGYRGAAKCRAKKQADRLRLPDYCSLLLVILVCVLQIDIL
ncbi:MAG: energy-coupling factor transporter transmembrane protein EcfT [Oscillospiraceae bacterium]